MFYSCILDKAIDNSLLAIYKATSTYNTTLLNFIHIFLIIKTEKKVKTYLNKKALKFASEKYRILLSKSSERSLVRQNTHAGDNSNDGNNEQDHDKE